MSDQPDIDGDVESSQFESFYEREYAATVRLAGFLSGDRTNAEDIAQDAFMRIRPEFERLANPGGYLRTTVVNLCRNHHRRTNREAVRLARHGVEPPAVSERAAELDETLHRLPYPERAVIVLRYWLGLSEAEIAFHLGCRPGTVKSRHARALTKIRKELP
ncbi:MAG: sigma-70 family RNA polymerase sigma factor [Actinobacteria bacterium]|nr:sigma-70 family RNA polymerase sigma factor [Actinomycetota bacterium]